MRATLIVFLSSAFLAIGCQQGIGDRCVQNSDCSSGICVGAGVQGGQCRATATLPGTGGGTGSGGSTGEGGAGGEAGQGGEAGSQGGHAGSTSDAGRDAQSPADARVD